VMAMQGDISFPTMDEFMPAFFQELQRDGLVDRAMAVARGKVRDRDDWWIPVLFSRLRDNQVLRPGQMAKPLQIQYFEPETVFVPSGPFWMGREPLPGGEATYDFPKFEVDLPAFRIGKYPVTNSQYSEFIRATGTEVNPETGWDGQTPPPDRLNHPVTGVTWYQAVAYCDWLSKKTGRNYSLPNEAQWEKAARGVQGWLYPWGDTWQEGGCNPDPLQITPVGQYPPQGPYGCYDLIGNLREWTSSLWGEKRSEPDLNFSYPWKDDGRNDLRANTMIRRVFRGGASENPSNMTCTARNGFAPDKSGPPGKRHGFRVVLTVEP
jgi:formylglycine-generating enzyme required for sulfatase activity